MNCTHCGDELTVNEIAAIVQTMRVHGIDFGWCRLCWDAWGTMTYGWQAGVPADRRVSFTDRARAWEARRGGPTFHGQWSDAERRRIMAEIEIPEYRDAALLLCDGDVVELLCARRPWRRWVSLQAHKA